MKKTVLTAIVLSLVFLNACKKEEASRKEFTLEMKVNGVLWTAAKNQAGLYNTTEKKLTFTGQKGDDIFQLSKDSMNGLGTYNLPSGTITLFLGTGAAQKQYSLSSSKPKTRGSVTLLTTTSNGTGLASLANQEYPEANFSGVVYDAFSVDSVVITEGKLRYQ